ncbi:MAG: DNA primase [Deltaproteobacteria bacterium]|nr:DNA primase [Deltaproteobacteria bacterium]
MPKTLSSTSNLIPEDKIREIRDLSSIVDVISSYVSLKKIGANHRGLCPFHNEKTPSFFVSEEKKLFNCFGCGIRGDVFTFLIKHENIGFAEAVKMLARRMGIELPQRQLSPEQQQRLSEQEKFFQINEQAALFYHQLLVHDKQGQAARRYLQERGFGTDLLKSEHYLLGFAPESWDTLVRHLKSKHLSLGEAQKIGLVAAGKSAGRFYDRFRGRIIFPIFNVSRRVIGFGGRIIGDGEPKYLNSPESAIYSKRHSLYGLHAAVKGIQQHKQAFIVEGYLDALALHEAGITNTVAALGTALTIQQIRIISRYTGNITTVFDADPAGQKAMMRSLDSFLACDIAPRLIVLPDGEDPDSFIQKHGNDTFQKYAKKAGLLFDFVIERILQKKNLADPRGKREACQEIAPLLNQITDQMERDLYQQKIARRIGVAESHIQTLLKQSPANQKTSDSARPKHTESPLAPDLNAELLILKLMTAHPETIAIFEKNSLFEDLSNPDIKELCIHVCTSFNQQGELNLPALMETIDNEQWQQLLTETTFKNDIPAAPVKVLEDCIRDLRLKKNSRQREEAAALLRQAEATHDEPLTRKYQQQCQSLLMKKQQILGLNFN